MTIEGGADSRGWLRFISALVSVTALMAMLMSSNVAGAVEAGKLV